ncbi:M23 family metallopeptidase [Desertivirga xinjiangensis]|uniref:M23 family metallopeptidase n=1 Tax=Desertivirga xinjiangensis TaxID=539206 RepID=UPI00210D09F4|nr:M23 family metallopeptidase [Pedobacter xinjiangensis]
MKIKIILALALVSVRLQAQENSIKITLTPNNDKSVDFKYDKQTPGSYYVQVTLKNPSNASDGPVFDETIEGIHGKLFTLKPQDPQRPIGFSYTYRSAMGVYRPKLKTDFLYIFPYTKNTKFRALESGFVGSKYLGQATPADWKAYAFVTNKEDSIVACRKGLVTEVKDLYKTEGKAGLVSYTSQRNAIYIEHADGSIARYLGFKHGSIAVKPGQVVYPGTFLGMNSNITDVRRYSFSLMLMYIKRPFGETGEDGKELNVYSYIDPVFYDPKLGNIKLTSGTEYTADTNEGIYKKELSKKELKLFGLSK